MTGILGDADQDPEGLVGGEEWGPLEEGSLSGRWPSPSPEKNDFFARDGILVNFQRYFFKENLGNNLYRDSLVAMVSVTASPRSLLLAPAHPEKRAVKRTCV